MFTWIRKLKAIVATYYTNLDGLHSRIDRLDALVPDPPKEATEWTA